MTVSCRSPLFYSTFPLELPIDTSLYQFNVIGIVKIIGVLSIGWTVERTLPSLLDVSGALLAIGGAWMYASATGAKKPTPPKQSGYTDDAPDSGAAPVTVRLQGADAKPVDSVELATREVRGSQV